MDRQRVHLLFSVLYQHGCPLGEAATAMIAHASKPLIFVALFGMVLSAELTAGQPAPLPADHAEKMAKGTELFKQQVRQVLIERCLKCHGGEKTQGDFDIASREGLMHGGKSGASIVPGNSKDSLLYKMVTHEEEPPMPQKEPKLPAAQIAALAQWIDYGAPYDKPLIENARKAGVKLAMVVTDKDRQFWSFQPLKKYDPPQVKNGAWCKTPIDNFVMAKLEEKGLTPTPPADKRKLVRRVYFDLIGLPPSPEEIEAFVSDASPDAYSKLVDKLLASPQYGERWARHWLDVARFAESHGFEQDYDRPHAYHYRDFVIKALNEDLPYDTFVKWQLAGDEFEPENPMALMATGFLGAGVFPTQITANEVERTRYDALDDMAATTGNAMLGLTIGCARCHDHKYDPLPTRDYYRMISTFTTTVRSNVDVILDPAPYKQAKARFDAEHKPLVEALAKYERDELPGKVTEYLKSLAAKPPEAAVWTTLDLVEFKSEGGATMTKMPDGSILVSGKNPDNDTFVLTAHTGLSNIRALKLEALADPSMKKNGPGRAENGNFALTNVKLLTWDRTKPPDRKDIKKGSAAIPVKATAATFEQKGLPASAAVAGGKTSGWAVDPEFGKNHAVVFEPTIPSFGGPNSAIQMTLKFENNKAHSMGRVRLSVSTQAQPPIDGPAVPQNFAEIKAIIATTGDIDRLNPPQREELIKWYRTLDEGWKKLNTAIAEHQKTEPKPKTEKVMIASEGVAAIRHHTQGGDFLNETHFLNRGDCNQKQGVAEAGFLQVLMTSPEKEARWKVTAPPGSKLSYRRTALAKWMMDTEHGAGHLVARVAVNRIWQHLLGKGIVATPNDFGFQGERPTHPELLDYLANKLIENGWKQKNIHKMILHSATYLQGYEASEAKTKIDPINAFIWRHDRTRLEAEAIRDTLLSISGSLDNTMFGPGSLDEGHKRRSVYFFIKRSKLIPMMQLFDVPEPNQSVGGRSATTIAPQALLFINNPHVRSWAQNFGKRLLPSLQKSANDAVTQGYLFALGRKPDDTELKDSAGFINAQLESYKASGKGNAQELALADFCQVLMSLNELIYVE